MFAAVLTVGFFVVIFLVALLSVLIAAEVMERRERAVLGAAAAAVSGDPGLTILREERVSSISPVEAILQKLDFVRLVQRNTLQAGLDWPVGRTAAMMLLCGTLALAFAGSSNFPSVIVAGITLFATLAPYLYILRRRRQRFTQFELQLPDAIDSLCRALKAGHPFAAGMEVVAGESYPPVSAELRKALDEWKLGMTWPQALDNLAERAPLQDVRIFVAAVKLHMRTGGKLGEVLGKLSENLRESVAIRGEVRAIAAHGRLTGMILTILPIALALIMIYVNPVQMMVLLVHPIGKILVYAAAICLVIAHFIIRKIVDIQL